MKGATYLGAPYLGSYQQIPIDVSSIKIVTTLKHKEIQICFTLWNIQGHLNLINMSVYGFSSLKNIQNLVSIVVSLWIHYLDVGCKQDIVY